MDVDECGATPGICGPNAVCRNTPGSFSCSCLPSNVGSPPSVGCRDPCQGVSCSEHAYCRPEGNEAYCVCREGWTYDPTNLKAGEKIKTSVISVYCTRRTKKHNGTKDLMRTRGFMR